MADAHDGTSDESQFWEEILGRRLEDNEAEKPTRPVQPLDSPWGPVRLSELSPSTSSPSRQEQEAPPSDHPKIKELARRLDEAESARRAAEKRVAELERQLTELRTTARPSEGEVVEQLKARLEEAEQIIRLIEDAYLTGEHRRHGPSQRERAEPL
jgi:hypothetical protein